MPRQSHGLLTGRLSVAGVPAAPDWMLQVLDGVDRGNALRKEAEAMLDRLYQATYWQLSERLSEFSLLLPDDADELDLRTAGLAHWCEGFLHGLVSGDHAEAMKARLAEQPLADVIRDLLQITRAGLDGDADAEENEAAFVEIVEYVRVAAQLCYEELADLRSPVAASRSEQS